MNDFDDLVKDFLVESYENLDRLDRDFVILEQEPTNRERLSSIFRTIHTIKGSCGFFGYSRLERLSHAGENLLSLLRDGQLQLTPAITSALLAMVDVVRELLGKIEAGGSEGEGDDEELIATLARLQSGEPAPQGPAPPAAPTVVSPVVTAPPPGPAGPEPPDAPTGQPTGEGSGVLTAAEADAARAARAPGEVGGSVSEGNIRVDVGLLDKLMNLVGELVLARNQILQHAQGQKDASFLGHTQRLNLITTELQEHVMKTRMQPIDNVWKKFPRVVRDVALGCGKQVRLEMEGKETELDKTLIEAIKDPLTHLIRNAVDHGIETPQVRQQRGKNPEGRLLLRAYHEGGQVNIEISDDGAGIDLERVKSKALERGLVTREAVLRMSDRELMQLVFLPGFSTAATVTNLSGRGVGMDVVKTNIEKIGGAVDLQSNPGQGALVKIKIPLTLAIIPALIVTTGGDRYAIPQASLLELVRLAGDQAERGIERIHGAPVYRLRGNLLPIVYLARQLELDETAARENQATNIVVLQAGERRFGLVVDGILDTEEIVVKPLSKQFKGISLFAGATIMGDGRVALILDVLGLAQQSSVVSERHDQRLTEHAGQGGAAGHTETLLLVSMGAHARMAIRLSQVARLEKVPADSVEFADGREVVQYRGQILPLLRLADHLGGSSQRDAEQLQVVVYTEAGRSVGLVVDRILDIVDTGLSLKRGAGRVGVQGSAVIQKRVTDVLDIHGLIASVMPDFFEEPLTVAEALS